MRLGDVPALPPGFACPFARCLPIIGGSGRVSLVSLLADLSDCAHAGEAMTRHVSSGVASFIKVLSFAPVSKTVRPDWTLSGRRSTPSSYNWPQPCHKRYV